MSKRNHIYPNWLLKNFSCKCETCIKTKNKRIYRLNLLTKKIEKKQTSKVSVQNNYLSVIDKKFEKNESEMKNIVDQIIKHKNDDTKLSQI